MASPSKKKPASPASPGSDKGEKGTAAPTPLKNAKGMSLHIGLNVVDPAHYGGWDGRLNACEFDARDMATLARSQGIKPTLLLSKQATRAAVLSAIRAAAKALKPGDLYVLSFSGHGGQVTDVTGEEDDGKDETWCLYDSQLIDDEIFMELSRFAAGVRVLVLSDSCHSGTVTRASPSLAQPVDGRLPRLMPPSVAMRTYAKNQTFYDKLQHDLVEAAGSRPLDPDAILANLPSLGGRITRLAQDVKAAVILVSGCQDNQVSMDGTHNGAFTEQLLRVWNDGRFKGSHVQFHRAVRAGLPPTQSPNLFTLGPARGFLMQWPFTV